MYKYDTDLNQYVYPIAHADVCEANVTLITR